MEKRLIVAIALSFVVLFAWQAIFVKNQPPQPPSSKPPEQAEAVQGLPAAIPQVKTESSADPQPQQSDQPLSAESEPVSGERKQEITIDTPLYRAVWSSQGGVLTSWRLKQHLNDSRESLELVSQASRDLNRFPFSLQTGNPDFDAVINSVLYAPSRSSLELLGDETEEMTFEYADGEGNRVEKRLIFWAGGYDIEIQVRVWKNGQPLDPYLVWGPQFGTLSPASIGGRMGGSPGISVHSGGKVFRHDERKFDPAKAVYNFVNWAGYDDQFFIALFLASPQESSAVFVQENIDQIPYYALAVNHVQRVYIGPKQLDLLSGLGHEAKRAVRFGLFGFITEILYVAIKTIHKSVPNWGWCIILLTFLIKIVFFPLTYSSTKSMAKMQELQPKIKALRSKYKKAKQDIEQRRKMNEETMRLYKEHGVNPAGGCLPMLIQLPIFWGFFQLLRVAVEFRHSPWILWISDLSVKDPIYVIPVLMGITQFISQKMTPTSADATQQRMMLIMPVIMTIFFISFPAGLVLYWLTNNVLQIGQQYIMNRFKPKPKKEIHGKPRKK
jgi:YidC/Oxa1 family membrane protein insertase